MNVMKGVKRRRKKVDSSAKGQKAGSGFDQGSETGTTLGEVAPVYRLAPVSNNSSTGLIQLDNNMEHDVSLLL